MKILMVCLGNICRSPMAEGIMRQKINEHQLNAQVDSCGTASYHIGDSPDERAQSTILKHGFSISNLRGRQFSRNDFKTFDMIFTMDESNYNNVLKLAKNDEDRAKVKKIMNMAYPNENIDVPDPYYGGINGFENVYKMLDLACEEIAIFVKN